MIANMYGVAVSLQKTPSFSRKPVQIRALHENRNLIASTSRKNQSGETALRGLLPALTSGAVACYLLFAGSNLPALAEVLSGSPRTVDGDTLEVAGTRIRLYGIDAPESLQMCKTKSGKDYSCGKLYSSDICFKLEY
eukprot:31623-Pyramimonas_sp.AAC.1